MALFDRKSTLGATLAAAATAGLIASPLQADEQNNAPAQMTQTASSSLSPELQALRTANQQSREFAASGFNVALILRAGQDIPNATFQTPEQLGERFRQRYQAMLDETYPGQNGRVAVFYAPNPEFRSSAMAAVIGDQLYQVDNEKYGRPDRIDPAILDLTTAWNAAPEIIEVLPTAKAVQRQNERQASRGTNAPDFALAQ